MDTPARASADDHCGRECHTRGREQQESGASGNRFLGERHEQERGQAG